QDERVHFSRPAIDVSFDSASEALTSRLCGVLLTGGSHDGALGLQCIQERNGVTVVEDPATASSPYMPQSAIDLIRPDFVGDIIQISNFLNKLDLGKGS